MTLKKNMLYILYFCRTCKSSGWSFGIKILFWISKSFGETEKSDPTPGKKRIILTFQQWSCTLLQRNDWIGKAPASFKYLGSIVVWTCLLFDEYTASFFLPICIYFYTFFGLIDRSIWYLFPLGFVCVDKVTVIPRAVFVCVRLCHCMKGSTAESKFIMLLGVNWFLQQHFLYSWCKISHKEMGSWLCHFMGSFLRELPRSASCMQGILLFLFRFFDMFDMVTSHNYLLVLLSVSQQRGLRNNPSIFTTVKLLVAHEDTVLVLLWHIWRHQNLQCQDWVTKWGHDTAVPISVALLVSVQDHRHSWMLEKLQV